MYVKMEELAGLLQKIIADDVNKMVISKPVSKKSRHKKIVIETKGFLLSGQLIYGKAGIS